MPRIKKLDRPVLVRAYIPQSIHDRMSIELYSELEGKIPHGAQTDLITELVTNWLKTRGVML